MEAASDRAVVDDCPLQVAPGAETGTLRRALAELADLHDARDDCAVATGVVRAVQAAVGPVAGFILLDPGAGPELLHSLHADGRELPDGDAFEALIAVARSGCELAGCVRGLETCTVPIVAEGRVLGSMHVSGLGSRSTLDAQQELLLLVGRHAGHALRRVVREPLCLDSALSLREAREAFDRQLILERLDRARGNIAQAARSLSMDRGQLSKLVKRHGIPRCRLGEEEAGGRAPKDLPGPCVQET